MQVSEKGIRGVLRRHGLNRLPDYRKRKVRSCIRRYEKAVPGHRVQVDVKFIIFNQNGKRIKRFQYTAIDDATRIRTLKIYNRHTQKSAIDFINHVLDRFPFRIHTIQTDNGHEFQFGFHCHCRDLGLNHVYIRPHAPHLNGKVERSHLTDQREFYQLLTYTNDTNLTEKLHEWESIYNCHRPHLALQGRTPAECLKRKMAIELDKNKYSDYPK